MDGAFVPSARALFSLQPWLDNFAANVVLVQFNHRMIAYLLVAAALWHALALARSHPGTSTARRARALAGLALAQMMLGIATLVLVVPLWAGLAHQALALMLVGMAALHARLCQGVARSANPTRISAGLAPGAFG
jgi:cytochrome c oxidase assembly protein subunit 15